MKRFTSSQKLFFTIVTLHLLLFFFPQFSPLPKEKMEKRAIVVHTKLISNSAIHTETAPIKKAAPPPVQKKAPPPAKKEKVIAKAPPKVKKTAPPEQPLLSKLKKNIGKIDTNPQVNLSTLKDPPKPLQMSSLQPEEEVDLTSCFTFFQESLELPDQGEVKVRMTLHPNGKIDQIQILSADSEANARYVIETLPTLTLKSYSDKTISFTVIFKGNS